jgi:hypothetical protein
MEALLRFLAGSVIAIAFAIWGGLPLVPGAILALSVGFAAAIWGDKVLVRLVSVVRLLR